jgi:UDP-N-acetylglucosamine--N-acetylmuramyl-(pentapeptide) pyrophosphoryl-undecaprenol N-acetylglucosamine transferase
MRAIVAGGGTAGHVVPAIAVARRLLERGDADVRFVGTATGLEAKLVPAAGIPFVPVEAAPLARRPSVALLRFPFVLLRAKRRCRLLVTDADVVVGMGGYASAPAVLAASRAKRPVVLHEQNAIPGLANRFLARRASAVAVSFPEARGLIRRRTPVVVTGNPIRDAVAAVPGERERLAKESFEELDLDPERRTVLVFGGSQGALHINRATVGACAMLRHREDLQVLLLTGQAHHDIISGSLSSTGALAVRSLPFLDRMELAYAVADLAVCRAGATTVAELTACGLPSLLIPYPYATGRHQEANARALQRAGAASLLLDQHLTPEELAERIVSLIDHRERLSAMAERARSLGRPDAADRMADLVAAVASGGQP